MSAVFTPCSVAGCPRNTAGYCPKCEGQPYVHIGPRISGTFEAGYQAGLKRAAEICGEERTALQKKLDGFDWVRGTAEMSAAIEQAILKEMEGENIGGIPVRIDESLPKDTAEFRQDGKTVGKITGLE